MARMTFLKRHAAVNVRYGGLCREVAAHEVCGQAEPARCCDHGEGI